MTNRFAVIGLDHRHAYDLTEFLTTSGMQCAGYWPETTDPGVLAGFRKRFPNVPEVAEKERLLDDPTIKVIVICAVPRDRAGIAVAAMQRGKDVLVDKPGVTTAAQLAEVEKTVAETRRIFSICFSERFLTPSTEMALKLVRDGAIGRVVQTVGLGPHRLKSGDPPVLVLGAGRLWRHPDRHRVAPDRPVHRLHQFAASRSGARIGRQLRR